MTERTYEIWGPPAGSSLIRLRISEHKRLIVHATTDFGEAHCGFDKKQAMKLHETIGELIKQL